MTVQASTLETAARGPVALTKQDAAKAWIHCPANQASILASFNTSTLTDTGTGDGTVNLTNAFSSTSYGIVVAPASVSGTGNATQPQCVPDHTTANAIRLISEHVGNITGVFADIIKCMAAFGTLG